MGTLTSLKIFTGKRTPDDLTQENVGRAVRLDEALGSFTINE